MRIAVIGARGIPVPADHAGTRSAKGSNDESSQIREQVTLASAATSGIEHYCAEMYPRIAAQGHTIDLFARASYTQQSWYHQSLSQGIRTISLPCLNLRGADAFISSALGAIASIFAPYDIVHFHALGPSLFSGLPAIASSSKVVVTCHGLDWQRAKWGKLSSRLIHLGEKMAVRYADEIIVVSEALQDYFWKTYQRKTVYIPNAPATYEASDPTAPYVHSLGLTPQRYVVFLGRLVPEKAPDLLLKAFRSLQPAGWKLVFVGKSSDTSSFTTNLLSLADQDPNIIFTGELSGSRLAEVVRGAGLFVLPSSLEGMPLSMLEAMQEGVPVLASNIPPHQQLVGTDRGVLFQTHSLEDLIDRLQWSIEHPQEMTAFAQQAQEFIRLNYRWDRITNDTIHLYESLAQRSPSSTAQPSGYHLSRHKSH
ncbi:MAG: glycosyltransferase family 4 protein [Oculatellaceae cyanobacterium Prado106]|jgi:glycosyltransferase involved in cell wall biosynthesis|nr:glycosyltransferase family 4 protein [Oculatellaceae cyanobacterium Prado106]